jgi:hypothetical protein
MGATEDARLQLIREAMLPVRRALEESVQLLPMEDGYEVLHAILRQVLEGLGCAPSYAADVGRALADDWVTGSEDAPRALSAAQRTSIAAELYGELTAGVEAGLREAGIAPDIRGQVIEVLRRCVGVAPERRGPTRRLGEIADQAQPPAERER